MRVVADVGNSDRLAVRQLILHGSIPLLRVGGFPGPLKSNKAQPIRTEIWTCRIRSGRRQPILEGSLLAVGISKGRVVVGPEKPQVYRKRIVVSGVRGTAEIFKTAEEDAIRAAHHELGGKAVREANARRKIRERRREDARAADIVELNSILRQERGEYRGQRRIFLLRKDHILRSRSVERARHQPGLLAAAFPKPLENFPSQAHVDG